MKTVFWSPFPFSGRKSSNMLLIAYLAGTENGREQLILHPDRTGSGPEHFLLSGKSRKRMMEQGEFGVELLYSLLRCERLEKSLVVNASYSFFNHRLHILPAGGELFYQKEADILSKEVVSLMKSAESVFDTVFIEAPAGFSKYSMSLCENADLVVFNLSQSPFELYGFSALPKFRQEVFLVGAYEKRCIYTKHNLERMDQRMTGKCEVIPYLTEYLLACAKGEAEMFLTREGANRRRDSYLNFFESARNAVSLINRQRG